MGPVATGLILGVEFDDAVGVVAFLGGLGLNADEGLNDASAGRLKISAVKQSTVARVLRAGGGQVQGGLGLGRGGAEDHGTSGQCQRAE